MSLYFTKGFDVMLNVLTLILVNVAFFICNIYPKHILELNAPLSAVAVLINLLYYGFYALFLFHAFRKGKDLFSGNLLSPFRKGSRKTELTRIVLILAVQIVLDFTALCLKAALPEFSYYGLDFLTAAAWVIFYFICTPNENSIFRTRRALIPAVMLGLFLAGAFFWDSLLLAECRSAFDRYELVSTEVSLTVLNAEFLFEFKNFLLDTLCGTLLLVLHGIRNSSSLGRPAVKAAAFVGSGVIRGIVILLCVWLAVALKYLAFPQSCLLTTEDDGSQILHYEASEIPFSKEEAVTRTLTRIDNHSARTVYQKTTHRIYYRDSLRLKYDSFTRVGNFDAKTAGEYTYYLYKEETIGYFPDEKPRLIYCVQAPGPESEILTAIYKNLIEECNWNFFEQGAEYLCEHDRDFIQPYLERYAAGDFTEDEAALLADSLLRASYVTDIAKELLND